MHNVHMCATTEAARPRKWRRQGDDRVWTMKKNVKKTDTVGVYEKKLLTNVEPFDRLIIETAASPESRDWFIQVCTAKMRHPLSIQIQKARLCGCQGECRLSELDSGVRGGTQHTLARETKHAVRLVIEKQQDGRPRSAI